MFYIPKNIINIVHIRKSTNKLLRYIINYKDLYSVRKVSKYFKTNKNELN